jgi:putative heme-binding domain-containing protein
VIGILDPNRAIDGKYKQYLARMHGGVSLSGVLVEETTSSLTLATADGQRHLLDRSEIEELKGHDLSMMPEGFERQLSTEALRKLIVYLQESQEL